MENIKDKYRARREARVRRLGTKPASELVKKTPKVKFSPGSPFRPVLNERGLVDKTCPTCSKNFEAKTDRFGQCFRKYCSKICYRRSIEGNYGKHVPLTTPASEYVRATSRAVYCPEVNMSFTSIRKATQLLKVSYRTVYGGLLYGRNSCGLTFQEYDFHKHPMPVHAKPWMKPGVMRARIINKLKATPVRSGPHRGTPDPTPS